ncbi:MAG: YraN family protein [Anaerolineae bacterium]
MSRTRVSLGQRGEQLAADQLVGRGYEIVCLNWYCQIGEVDIVTCREESWTFFEVRTRRGRAFGTPEESVTPAKMERMAEVAQLYLSEHGINVHEVDWRLGVVAVEMDEAGRLLRVDVYENLS